jgi:helix-turn-helix protein
MSWELISTILHKRIPEGKLLVVALAEHCHGDSWTCFPSLPRLVELCGVSKREIYRWLRKLKQRGFVTTERRGPQPISSTLHPDLMPDITGDRGVTSMDDRAVTPECATGDKTDKPSLMEKGFNRVNATEKSKTESSAELFPTYDALPDWLPRAEWKG